jgi:E2F-associated phosphoprotein
MNPLEDRMEPNRQFPLVLQQQMIVTSCEEDSNDGASATDSSSDSDSESVVPDDLFDDQADEDDEAYVYRHLRSGAPSVVDTASPTTKDSEKHTKPRNSDAVLSCPACFRIVCMDCQRHEHYKNQYRAMFVMSVTVRWDLSLQYDPESRCLVPCQPANRSTNSSSQNSAIRCEDDRSNSSDCHPVPCGDGEANAVRADGTIYYTVCCANCHTTVAALDMSDEVYHFSGCLASS